MWILSTNNQMDWRIEGIKRAIYEEWLGLLNYILESDDANNIKLLVNFALHDDESFLHSTSTADFAEKLLCYGSNVNGKNKLGETPLHKAIIDGKGLKLVRMLIEHGADINALDNTFNTPLNLACSRSCIDLDIIKELLENGADIDIRNCGNKYCKEHKTALENSSKSLVRTKLIIKITLFRNLDKDYKSIINVSSLEGLREYAEIVQYHEKCVNELDQMKIEFISSSVSLYTFIAGRKLYEALCTTDEKSNFFIRDSVFSIFLACKDKYPIYSDMIINELKSELICIPRSCFLKQLRKLKLHTNTGGNGDVTTTFILNVDCTSVLSQFLSEEDLLNVLIAFYDSTNTAKRPVSLFYLRDENADGKCVKV